MLRVIIAGGRGFNDQRVVQTALMQLQQRDPRAVVVVGAYEAEQMAGKIWKLLGGQVDERLPDWKRHHKDAGRIRDTEVLKRSADLCIAFTHGVDTPYMARRLKDTGVKVIEYHDGHDVIDALP